jgi:hypothetical protein
MSRPYSPLTQSTMAVGGCGLSRRTVLMLRVVFLIAAVSACIGYLVPVTDSLKSLNIVPSTLSRLCPAPSLSVDHRPPVLNGIPTKSFRGKFSPFLL